MKKETYCVMCGTKTTWGGKTCSRKCAGELKTKESHENRNCKVCGTEFTVYKNTETDMCSDKCRKEWGSRPENIKKRLALAEKAVFEKYGVKSTLQLESVKEKIKETKIEKYGNANFVNPKKAKSTKKEKYGDENYNNHEQSEETKSLIYGDKNYNNRDMAVATMTELYGVPYAIQRQDFKDKAIATNNLIYGANYSIQNKEIKQKAEQTCIKKYGGKSPSCNEEVKEKMKASRYEKFPETMLFKKMENSKIKLLSEYVGIKAGTNKEHNTYDFQCFVCQNVFKGTFSNNRPPVCRKCYPLSSNGTYQLDIKSFLETAGILSEEFNRQIIKPYELDFYMDDKNTAIEFNGNYYHSEIGGEKDKNYHLMKTEMCSKKNIILIHIFEDEWVNKQEIVKSNILNLLEKTEYKIRENECLLIEVSEEEKSEFLDKNHIQGNKQSEINIALKHNNEMVFLMTFSTLRKNLGNKQGEKIFWELSRFCSKTHVYIDGAFEKTLSYFIEKYSPKKIVSDLDCRWFGINPEKTILFKNKFIHTKTTKPSYWYFRKNNYLERFHRSKFSKNKLLELYGQNIDIYIPEWEIAQLLNMDRIWDCGSMKFELNVEISKYHKTI